MLNSLDLPDPFLPMSAYLCPALICSLVSTRISVPSLLALALPLAPGLVPGPEVTVMWRPSTSNCRRLISCESCIFSKMRGYLAMVRVLYIEPRLLAGAEDRGH